MQIYRGILAVTRDPALRDFATRHHATESRHLSPIEAVLPASERSRLLPLWRMAGWLTGAIPSPAGPRALYATITAVRSFVEGHYGSQIERPRESRQLDELPLTLETCRRDKVAHRDEAAAAIGAKPRRLLSLRMRSISVGSGLAVAVSRRL